MALAVRLTEATGSETRILRTPQGGYRLETVSSDFDPVVVDAVLADLVSGALEPWGLPGVRPEVTWVGG
ncbi:hypothetical protein ACFQ2M_02920 [Kitasatospora saccharophila]|uniref:hypothetical protein n=1 Tax=Kitasatospora saccharophila TaxID=407973 RepID=UPI0031D0C426